MRREGYEVFITEVATGNLVEAVLYDEISGENLKAYREKWQPQLKAARQAALEKRKHGIDVPQIVEDAHWDWDSKVLKTKASLSHRHFALECEGSTEGLMQIELTLHRSRLEPRRHLVYIDYLAVAPWDRKMVVDPPRYKGIGSVLLAQAIGTSFDEDFEGRVGLHALPGAIAWYTARGLNSFGQDSEYQNLEYFEMSKAVAEKFMDQMK